jgi:uncharacterized membrane protein YczE
VFIRLRKIIQVFLGTTTIGIGISFNYIADLGLGPWGVFHDGLSKTIGLPYGRTIIFTGIAVMLFWIPLKQKPGLGTFVDLIWIGSVADLIIPRFQLSTNTLQSLVLIFFGILLIGIGTAVYVGAGLGVGPREGIKIGTARILIELFAFISGWILGGNVGYVTILFVIGIGPVVQLILPYVDIRNK